MFIEGDKAVHNFSSGFAFLDKYYMLYLIGAKNTLLLAIFAIISGIIIGISLALMRISKYRLLKFISSSYIELVRGTPLLVQLYIIYYGFQMLGINFPNISIFKDVLGINSSDFIAGAITLGLNSAAYVGEIFRAGIQAVPKGQMEAARSLGFTYTSSMKNIILPQAIRNVLPALGNEFVVIIKESSIVSIIGIADLMYNAETVRSNTYQPIEPLVVVALIYFMITFPLSKLLAAAERRMRYHD